MGKQTKITGLLAGMKSVLSIEDQNEMAKELRDVEKEEIPW